MTFDNVHVVGILYHQLCIAVFAESNVAMLLSTTSTPPVSARPSIEQAGKRLQRKRAKWSCSKKAGKQVHHGHAYGPRSPWCSEGAFTPLC